MSDWPKYESHKIVQAAKITRLEFDLAGGRIGPVTKIYVDPGDGTEEAFWPTIDDMAQKAETGGWAILYPDGFKSISPAKQFEEGYTLIQEQTL